MPLHQYREKRDFSQTPEPEPTRRDEDSGNLRFVVQKHAATNLHYDLRLEAEGILKSWAIPKGPSLNPGVKRLAIMVEDHPLSYFRFEGVIPAGNYGAGTVMVWDLGNYCLAGPESSVSACLRKGHLNIVLQGRKLNGGFTLIRHKQDDSQTKNAWLLIKNSDNKTAREDVLVKSRSALSNRSMEEIQAAAKISPHPVATGFPRDIRPMLATLAEEPVDGKDWVFEVKWDGYRCLAFIENKAVTLLSRNGQPFNQKFPEISSALSGHRLNAVFDGEITALDKEGRSSFQLLQNYLKTGRGNLVYYIFDLLYLEDRSLIGLPLIDRKNLLQSIIPDSDRIKFSGHVPTEGRRFFETTAAAGIEGIVAKRIDSRYEPGKRSKAWLKIKARKQQKTVIGGFTEPRGGRRWFGALLLGVFDDQQGLTYVGHVGAGFSDTLLEEIYTRLCTP